LFEIEIVEVHKEMAHNYNKKTHEMDFSFRPDWNFKARNLLSTPRQLLCTAP